MRPVSQSAAAQMAFMRLASGGAAEPQHAGDLRVIRFEVRRQLPLLNELLRMREHERMRAKQEIAEAVHAAVLPLRGYGRGWQPIRRCLVTVEIHRPGRPDWDGMMGGIKYLLDALVVRTGRNPRGCGLILDDSQDCIAECPRIVPVCTGRGGPSLARVMVEEIG